MTTDDRWKRLIENARKQINIVDKPSYTESFIEYECEPSFEPIFTLQILWTEKGVKWRRAEWDFLNDWNKFYETDGKPKVILSQPEPTLKIHSGTAAYSILAEIVSHVRQLKINPRVDGLKMITLDGSEQKLSLGVGELRTTYVWHTLPDEWIEIGKLADMVKDLFRN